MDEYGRIKSNIDKCTAREKYLIDIIEKQGKSERVIYSLATKIIRFAERTTSGNVAHHIGNIKDLACGIVRKYEETLALTE